MQAANVTLGIPSFDTMNTQDYIELEQQYGADNYHPLDVVITKGQGVWIWEIDWALEKIELVLTTTC
ncbi:hypothetical protein [Nostoc sp. NMS8]|uniref:hypothetical protein n=1 Tax=Nostoc sp. NMS8 TaxID=2815392 RepID=UPI0025D79F81|nr:hypothetical protein [Nostoc sp. NMS8]